MRARWLTQNNSSQATTISGPNHAIAVAATAKPMLNAIPNAGIAQLVEHLICNQGVAGSNPAAGTIKPLLLRGFLLSGVIHNPGTGTGLGQPVAGAV